MMPTVDWGKRRIFAREYALSNNATEAAKKAGVPPPSAHSVGYKWLRNPEIIKLIKEEIDLAMRSLGRPAVDVIRDLMLDPDAPPRTRLAAAKDVLDRLGWVPPKRSELAITTPKTDVENMTRAELEAAAAEILQDMREKST